jgi:F-type H+-transporting ATPase subunit gamma
MSSLKDLRTRIVSVKATQKVTKAMQLVAASKLRKVQEAAEMARPYAKRMERVVTDLAWRVADQADASKLLVGTGSEQRMLCLVATTERGLCGGLNAGIVRMVKDHVDHFVASGRDVKLLCIGSKGYRMLRPGYGDRIVDVISLRDVRRIGYADAHNVATRILDMYAADEYDVCCIFFAEFRSLLSQKPRSTQLVPVKYARAMTLEEMREADERAARYDYEPDDREFLEALLPAHVGTQIYRALLENAASEQGARMIAMDGATRNAGELIDRLTLEYNRLRQSQITRELIEIISAVESLQGK